MGDPRYLTGQLLKAGRVLSGLTIDRMAKLTGVASDKIRAIESGGGIAPLEPALAMLFISALDRHGVSIVAEAGTFGAGVRLKHTLEVRFQIMALETEGGSCAHDVAM